MPISIVANSSANYAQSGMRVRNEAMQTNTQKLSSGLRVFSAKEDAAALAVGTSLRVENSILKTAALNASAGISMLQIADGAMGQISDLLTRMLTLAQTASSGHVDDATRALVNTEFSDLKDEVDRLSRNTSFNDVRMLAGSADFVTETVSDIAADGIANMHFDQTLVSTDSVFRYSYNATTEVLTMNRVDGATVATQAIDLTALLDNLSGVGQNMESSQRLEVGFSSLGITLTLDSSFDRTAAIAVGGTLAAGPDITVATPAMTVPATNVPLDVVLGLQDLAGGYNASTGNLSLVLDTDGAAVRLGSLAGISYNVNGNGQGASGQASDDLVGAGPNTVEVYVDLPGGGTSLIGTWTTGAVATTGATDGGITLAVGRGVIGADYQDSDGATRLTYKIGVGLESGLDILNVDIPATTLSALGLATSTVTTQTAADNAITAVQNALTTLNQARATVGAQQLRLEKVYANVNVVTENNERARSDLLDVDVAREISDFANNQAMLEAGVAMLGRANKIPELLIQLLRNA